MTVTAQTSSNSSTGNGVTTVFPYTFKIIDDGDIEVRVDGVLQTLSTHYTVSGVGDNAGGNVTMLSAPANGAIVARRRNMALVREVDYQYQGTLPAAVLNPDQDAPVLMAQQLQEQIGRSLRGPAGETWEELAAAADRLDLFPVFDATTGALELSTVTQTQVASAVAAAYAAGSTADAVTFLQEGTGATSRTVQAKLRESVSVTDFGAVADSSTDNTASILAAAVSSGKKFFIVPYGVKYNRASLLAEASFPDDVVLLDFSGINDFSAPGETTKHFGIVSKDSAPDDTHWAIDSGHHAILTTNNFGTAGTTSADERKASWLWAAGQLALGATNKRGFRGAAIQQFTKETGNTFWKWQIRSIAPWVSIAGEYEYWESGQVISGAGVYRLGTTSQQYVSAGAGTTGATPPTHTSGTVSDGGVSWTWIDSGDRTLFQVDQYGRWIIGAGNTGAATWSHKVAVTDPSGSYRFKGISTGVTKIAQLQLIPTDGAGTEVEQPFLRAEVGAGLRVMNSTASTSLAAFTDAGGFGVNGFASLSSGAVNSSTGSTPSVDGIGTIYIGNGGATNITDLTNASNDQIVHLVFTNANTTLVSSATFLLAGSVNVTPTAYSVVTMKRVHSSISGRWIEMSRSIK